MKRITVITCGLCLALASPAAAAGPDPCKQIVQQCESAGFIKGDWKLGIGLWKDCLNPIMTGTPATGAKKPLPAVDPSVVSACKAKHPNFAENKNQK
jgi:hypothetical protein